MGKRPLRNDFYFRLLNQALIDSLATHWYELKSLSQNGISDIVAGDKKIAGTSLFRSRNYLLYQASVLINLDLELVKKCLAHPTKEPSYRQGRKHEDFLAGLDSICGSACQPEKAKEVIELSLESCIRSVLTDELIEPIESQMRALSDRLSRTSS